MERVFLLLGADCSEGACEGLVLILGFSAGSGLVGVLLRIVLKLRTDCYFGLSRGAHSQSSNPTQKIRSVKKSRRAWSACRVRRSEATETNTAYPAPRGKPCLFWKHALFATWGLIALRLELRADSGLVAGRLYRINLKLERVREILHCKISATFLLYKKVQILKNSDKIFLWNLSTKTLFLY